MVKAKLLAIGIMTIFIPIVFFFMLRTLEKVSSHFLEEVKERKWPLLFYAALDFVIMKYVLDAFDYPELYYFFLGVFTSTLAGLVMVIFRIKISLHMMGLAGLTTFLILLSLHFNLNLVYSISFLIAITGLTASSRLQYKAHTMNELAFGIVAGPAATAGSSLFLVIKDRTLAPPGWSLAQDRSPFTIASLLNRELRL